MERESSVKKLKPPGSDKTSAWKEGMEAIEARMEARRDDLRDKGMPDGPQMESLIGHERKAAIARLEQDLKGETEPTTWDDQLEKSRLC